jgi:hypothetical protein
MAMMILRATLPVSATVRRNRCFRRPDLPLFKCRLPARFRKSFPLADTLNRFFAPLWVFIFGMATTPFRLNLVTVVGHSPSALGYRTFPLQVSEL